MKRFWHKCFALIAVAAMSSTANAQWNQQPEIGSYQSILSRAGYQQNGIDSQMQASPTGIHSQSTSPAMQGNAMHGNAMHGNAMHGNAMQGNAMQGNAMHGYGYTSNGMQPSMNHGTVISSQPMAGSINGGMMMPNQVAGGCASGCATGNMGGMVGGPVVSGGMVDYTDYGSGYAGEGCGPVYTPGASIGASRLGGGFANRVGLNGGGGVNRVGSIFGVILNRNYEDDVRLAYNGAGQEIFSGDVDQGRMSGLGAALTTRNCNGNGWEVAYWGIDDDFDVSLAGPTFTNLNGLADLNHVPAGTDMFTVFNNGTDARFYRDVEINSVAFNLLRNGGAYQTRRGQQGNFELLGGLRLFQFDESFRYVSNSAAPWPLTSEYQLQAENFLVGLQFGGRNEICLSNRLRLATAVTAGLFNNRIETRHRIFDETGYSPVLGSGPSAGRPYDYMDQKDDVAMMGELNVGLIYQLSSKFRARVGYQVLGVSGVALAVDQIPRDFTDSFLHQSANSNGSLIMQGLYFGTEFCF